MKYILCACIFENILERDKEFSVQIINEAVLHNMYVIIVPGCSMEYCLVMR